MNSNVPKILKNLSVILLVVVLIGYALYNSRIFIAGPKIEVSEPKNGATISDSPLVRIKGKAENIAFINLNDRQINTDENGFFDETVLLYPGYNIIKIDVKDKFERKIEENIELIYAGSEIIDPNESLETKNSTTSLETTNPENNENPVEIDMIIEATTATSSLEEI